MFAISQALWAGTDRACHNSQLCLLIVQESLRSETEVLVSNQEVLYCVLFLGCAYQKCLQKATKKGAESTTPEISTTMVCWGGAASFRECQLPPAEKHRLTEEPCRALELRVLLCETGPSAARVPWAVSGPGSSCRALSCLGRAWCWAELQTLTGC